MLLLHTYASKEILLYKQISLLLKRIYATVSFNRIFCSINIAMRTNTCYAVILLLKKCSKNALVQSLAQLYICIQKLIDVQQTLIKKYPNPLKNKYPKDQIQYQSTSFFLI